MSELCVFIVDDDEAVRESLRALLEIEGMTTRTFSSADNFLAAYSPEWRGCMLLDVRMPGMDGLELLEMLGRRGASLPVVLMTGHGDVPLAVRAMKAGAIEFLEKPINDEVLLDTLRLALDEAARRSDDQRMINEIAGRIASLTGRERDVLERLVVGAANKVIAYELGISPRTVEVYRARVMEKMQAKSLSQLVRMSLAAGITG